MQQLNTKHMTRQVTVATDYINPIGGEAEGGGGDFSTPDSLMV